MITLHIETENCIRCGRCTRVCPSLILKQASPHASIEIVQPENCIACGHCVAICPVKAVLHSEFPEEKIHSFENKDYPTAAQLMLLCKARRSNRAFSTREIPEETLDQILEAAHRAPTASNLQQVEFTLITDPEKLRFITEFTLNVFRDISRKLRNPFLKPLLKITLPDAFRYLPVFDRLLLEYRQGNDLILRKATAVLFIHCPASNRFGVMDANLAYQNGSLMAECLGVSQFYTGFVCTALQQEKKNTLATAFGINGRIHAGMALGMPEFRFSRYMDKKERIVNVNPKSRKDSSS